MKQNTQNSLANRVEMIVSTSLVLAYLIKFEFLWKRN